MKTIIIMFLLTLFTSCSFFLGECEVNGKTYSDGESFKDGCQDYVCVDGDAVQKYIVDCVEVNDDN
ncbi:MAG: hypothetical protein OCC49_01020 [Fibrobacterales bacterium]